MKIALFLETSYDYNIPALPSLAVRAGAAAVPPGAVLPAVQLPALGRGAPVAGALPLGLGLLDRGRGAGRVRGLPHLHGHDVLPEVRGEALNVKSISLVT